MILQMQGSTFTETDNVNLRHLNQVDIDMHLHLNDSLRNLYSFPMKNINRLYLYANGDDMMDQDLLIESKTYPSIHTTFAVFRH